MMTLATVKNYDKLCNKSVAITVETSKQLWHECYQPNSIKGEFDSKNKESGD